MRISVLFSKIIPIASGNCDFECPLLPDFREKNKITSSENHQTRTQYLKKKKDAGRTHAGKTVSLKSITRKQTHAPSPFGAENYTENCRIYLIGSPHDHYHHQPRRHRAPESVRVKLTTPSWTKNENDNDRKVCTRARDTNTQRKQGLSKCNSIRALKMNVDTHSRRSRSNIRPNC